MRPLRGCSARHKTVAVKQGEVTADRPRRRGPCRRPTGQRSPASHLVLAMGTRANFFGVTGRRGARVPALLRRRRASASATAILRLFEDADLDPARIEQGALNFVDRRWRCHRRRDGRRPRRPDPRRDAAAVPRPRTSSAPASTSSTRSRGAGALLRQGPRVRRQDPRQEGRRAPARPVGHRGRRRSGRARRRLARS